MEKHARWHEALTSHMHWPPPQHLTRETITTHRHPRPGADYLHSGEHQPPGADLYERQLQVVTDITQPFATPPKSDHGRL